MAIGVDHHVHLHEPGTGDDPLTLVLLHGTGADERDLLPLGRFLAPGVTLLSPRGNVAEHGMNRFFARHAEGVFDRDDLVRRTHELADWLQAAVDHYHLDPTRLVAAGFSNGANIAAWLLLLRPEVLRGAALFAPMLPFEPDQPGELSAVAVHLSAGRRDPICPPEQAERLAQLLSERGAAVELSWHDGGHELPRTQAEATRAWLERLRGATASDPGHVA
ncbi:alpha/beta hydrolase [Egicoccus sp. AB-alg2]|uniref:alpha/beta hydrolase n=1 Tax=Egicoccus sp. AB-alg2 TaxID=3242693 RepID=UPI00359E29CB